MALRGFQRVMPPRVRGDSGSALGYQKKQLSLPASTLPCGNLPRPQPAASAVPTSALMDSCFFCFLVVLLSSFTGRKGSSHGHTLRSFAAWGVVEQPSSLSVINGRHQMFPLPSQKRLQERGEKKYRFPGVPIRSLVYVPRGTGCSPVASLATDRKSTKLSDYSRYLCGDSTLPPQTARKRKSGRHEKLASSRPLSK